VNGFHCIRKRLPMDDWQMVLLRCGYSWWLHGWSHGCPHGWVEKQLRCGNEEQ
jgi:hypothetical protein